MKAPSCAHRRCAPSRRQVEFGTQQGVDPNEFLSDDFQFVAPIIGPLGKKEFLNAFGSFKVCCGASRPHTGASGACVVVFCFSDSRFLKDAAAHR